MLRITPMRTEQGVTLRLEGKLLEAWVPEVAEACRTARLEGGGVSLDLSRVTFMDAAGRRLLDDLACTDVKLVACSRFVAALLQMEDRS